MEEQEGYEPEGYAWPNRSIERKTLTEMADDIRRAQELEKWGKVLYEGFEKQTNKQIRRKNYALSNISTVKRG